MHTLKRRQFHQRAMASLGLLGLPALAGCARGGSDARFVVAINSAPPTLDYAASANGANVVKPMFENIVEPLLGRDDTGNIEPLLATYRLSADLKTAHFTLREGVKFHDGSPFTADDVLFSHERMKAMMPIYRSRTRTLTRLEVIDDMHVDMHFETNALSFVRNSFLYIYSRRYHERVGEEAAIRRLVGTGPYRLAEHRQFQFVDLDAFEHYWGPKPTIERAKVMFVPEDMTRIAMLYSGEADLIMAVPFSMVPQLRSAGYALARADIHPTISLRFQLANPDTPWADLRVRQALACGIDSQAIVDGLFAGIPQRYGGFAPGEAGYDPGLAPIAYDPQRARDLLREAGYESGFSMPLVYWTNAYYGMRETTEAVVLYLQQLGIDCEVSGIDTAQGLAMNREAAQDPKARLVTIAPSLLASYGEPSEAMRQGYSSGSAFSWYRNEEFDETVELAQSAADADVYDGALQRAARILQRDLPIIPLWNNVALYMMQPEYAYLPKPRDIPSLTLANVTRA